MSVLEYFTINNCGQ